MHGQPAVMYNQILPLFQELYNVASTIFNKESTTPAHCETCTLGDIGEVA